MGRPYKILEQVLAEMQNGKSEPQNSRCRSRSNTNAAQQTKVIEPDAGQDDDHQDFDFPEKFLTKRKLQEFAKEKGVPKAAITELIKDGKLKVRKFPNYNFDKFSTKQLGRLLKNYNKIFIFLFCLEKFSRFLFLLEKFSKLK